MLDFNNEYLIYVYVYMNMYICSIYIYDIIYLEFLIQKAPVKKKKPIFSGI